MGKYDELIRVLVTIVILLLGFVITRVFTRISLKVARSKKFKGRVFNSLIEKVFFALTVIISLVYLGFTSIENFASRFIALLPEVFLMILLILLGVLIVQLIMGLIEKFMTYARFEEMLSEDISQNLVPLLLLTFRIILYIILVNIVINIIDIPELRALVNFFLYPVMAIILLLIFVALINPMRDFSSSFYLKNIWRFRPGNRIRYDDKFYTVKRMMWLSTELENPKGGFMIIPNRELAAKGLEFEKPSKEIQNLEDLKRKYVAQLPSLCGPASAQIALSIWGIEADQREIARMSSAIVREKPHQIAGTHPKNLIKSIQKVTDAKVLGAWITFSKIQNLKKETNTWLSEGGLLIVDYEKRYLFPTAVRAHYSLCVGIRGDELLIIDPNAEKGGVYFVDYRDVEVGMDTYSELIKGRRGYIILAPKGTAAYERIKEGLIYQDASSYRRLSRRLEMKLNKLTNASGLRDMMPSFVKKKLNNLEKEQISRLWKP